MNSVERAVYEVLVEDVEYSNQDGRSLMATVYRPEGVGPFPMMIEVHGGAWCRGSRHDEHSLNHALASQGMIVAAIDFRMPPEEGYPASFRDINLALRWFKATAARWHTQRSTIGIMGVSSGGHQAVLCALRAHDQRYTALSLPDGLQADARAAFVVACWPVIDPLARYRYAKERQTSGESYPEALDRVIPDHEKYWMTEEAMDEGGPAAALERGEALEMPPILCIQGEADGVHPRQHLERFAAAYRAGGGEITVRVYPDQAEGFITKKPQSDSSLLAIGHIATFVKSRGVPY